MWNCLRWSLVFSSATGLILFFSTIRFCWLLVRCVYLGWANHWNSCFTTDMLSMTSSWTLQRSRGFLIWRSAIVRPENHLTEIRRTLTNRHMWHIHVVCLGILIRLLRPTATAHNFFFLSRDMSANARGWPLCSRRFRRLSWLVGSSLGSPARPAATGQSKRSAGSGVSWLQRPGSGYRAVSGRDDDRPSTALVLPQLAAAAVAAGRQVCYKR